RAISERTVSSLKHAVTTTATNWNLAVSGSTDPLRAVTSVTATAAAVMTAASGVGSSQVAKSTARSSMPPRVGLFGTTISMIRTRTITAAQPRKVAKRVNHEVGWRGAKASRRRRAEFTSQHCGFAADQAVADAATGLDEHGCARGLELAPPLSRVDLDQSGFDGLGVTPDGVVDLLLAQ